jgi:hypothetical protein
MSTVTETRIVVVVGRRPRHAAAEVVADVRAGDEAVVLVLGLEPSTRQRRLVEDALALAAERGFVLTAELVPTPSRLSERLRSGDDVRVVARSAEKRRWRLDPAGVTARDVR